jgi:hypothetical protein
VKNRRRHRKKRTRRHRRLGPTRATIGAGGSTVNPLKIDGADDDSW